MAAVPLPMVCANGNTAVPFWSAKLTMPTPETKLEYPDGSEAAAGRRPMATSLSIRRCSSGPWLDSWQMYVGIALLWGIFLLLAREDALQEFGAFLLVAAYAMLQKYFTSLRNTPGLQLRHLLELHLLISGNTKSEWRVFSYIKAIVRENAFFQRFPWPPFRSMNSVRCPC